MTYCVIIWSYLGFARTLYKFYLFCWTRSQLNLVIYYLKNDEVNEAYQLIKDMDCQEYILKAVVHAVIGQNTDSKDHMRISQNNF